MNFIEHISWSILYFDKAFFFSWNRSDGSKNSCPVSFAETLKERNEWSWRSCPTVGFSYTLICRWISCHATGKYIEILMLVPIHNGYFKPKTMEFKISGKKTRDFPLELVFSSCYFCGAYRWAQMRTSLLTILTSKKGDIETNFFKISRKNSLTNSDK